MAFIQARIKNTRDIEPLDIDPGTVTTKGQLLARVSDGVVIPATSASTRADLEGVCNQSLASTDTQTQVPAIMIDPQDTWIADLANNSDPLHNYQRMVLSDSEKLNNTGTDSASGVASQVEPYGPAANKQAIVRFV